MSNKKQTAVDWLIQEIKDYFPVGLGGIDYMVLKSKEMDKQQKIEDYRAGRTDQQSDKLGKSYNRRAEDYYKETYGE